MTVALFDRAIFPHDGETQIVGEFLSSDRGFFVEVGANDPKNGSQTWHLEQRGWTGILIEPQPELAKRLRQERSARVYDVACSSPENTGKSMPLHMAGLQTSLNPAFFSFKMKREGVVEARIRTLDDILIDANAPSPIDFVSIDVESHEIDVLEGFDLNRWQPRLLLIEDMVLDRRLHTYLRGRGYRWVRRTALNSWYVPSASSMRVSPFGKLQFTRKYFLGVPFRRARETLRKIRSGSIRQQI